MAVISLQTSEEICALLGERARRVRLAQNLTQAELAGRADVSFGAVRKLETGGKTTLDTFVKVASALGAATDFERLLAAPLTSIAQMERESAVALRKRARRANPQPRTRQ